MKVTVRESTLIKPLEDTPKRILWTSNVDQLFKMQMPCVYIYKPNGCSNFFDANVMKQALSKVLVTFYPVAGRLKRSKHGRSEIDCNGEGVLFVEAHTGTVLDELGDFTPSDELMKLIPRPDDNDDMTVPPPLLLVQVTYFKCGGASLGIVFDHIVADGMAGTFFINSWSKLAQGLELKIQPYIERTPLQARSQPTPSFPHIEHQPSPTMKNVNPGTTAIATFKVTLDQISLLKAQCKEEPIPVKYSSYEVLAAHIWRCACRARLLEVDQETKLSIATDGRSRLNPPLPYCYLGNAIFHMTPMARSGDLLSRPLVDTVKKIRDTLVMADDKYIKSALDYLELQSESDNKALIIRGSHTFRCPNLAITSWCGLPVHEADFGWGKPVFMGPGSILYEGLVYVLPSTTNDGSVLLAISLLSEHMAQFKRYLYDI